MLNQCLDILPRALNDRSLLREKLKRQSTVLFRIPKKNRGEWIWHDEFKLPEVEQALDKVKYDRFYLEDYKQLPVLWKTLQVDIVLQPFPIREKDGEIRYHFMLIALDPVTELVVMGNMLKSAKRYETTLNGISNLIMEEMIKQGGRPARIEYRNPDLALVLQLFKDLAGTEIVFKRNLEPLGPVIITLIDQLSKQKSR